jgi:hypothetical protein
MLRRFHASRFTAQNHDWRCRACSEDNENHMISDRQSAARNNTASLRVPVETLFTLRIEQVRWVIRRMEHAASGWFPTWHPGLQRPVIVDVQLICWSDTKAEVLLTFAPAVCPPVQISLVAQFQPFGGIRWWLTCPSSGERVGRLYWLPAIGVYVSRNSANLCYAIQNEGRNDRLLRRVGKIRRRLRGDAASMDLPRPKGMRRKTYKALLFQLQIAERDAAQALPSRLRWPRFKT